MRTEGGSLEDAKPAVFIGSSLDDIREMPRQVRVSFGKAIWEAQCGRRSGNAKPLKGFRGAGVLEVVEDFSTDTYRAVYTVRFAGVVYVLHAFQKKSTRGAKTAARELRLVEQRLQEAVWHHEDCFGGKGEV